MNEWPDIIYEDVLDAEEVVPSVEFPRAPVVWGKATSYGIYLEGKLIAKG